MIFAHPMLFKASRNIATIHSYCLLFLLLIFANTASAVQPRQEIPPVTLSTSAVNDFNALSSVDHYFELLVKFDDSVQARMQKGALVSESSRNRLTQIEGVVAAYSASFEQILSTNTCPNIDTLLNQAVSRSGIAQPDLKGLHRVNFPSTLSGQQLLNLRNDLLARGEIEFVELRRAGPGAPPSVTPDFSTGPAPSQTLYRGPDPGGNFDFAHSLGVIGTGIRLSEVSVAYNFLHEEFVSGVIGDNALTPLESYVGSNPVWDDWVDHGTATLSQNLAPDNGFGVKGMTYGANGQFYRSFRRSGTNSLISEFDKAYCNALADSVATGDGNVVYLEHQTVTPFPGDPVGLPALIPFGGPMEIQETAYLITKVGTDAGVVVLMPGGNGNLNLDTNTNNFVQAWRDRPDSGAIIVGAGTADLNHDRLSFSSFGSRLNLQGWGQNVIAAGYGDLAQVSGDINRRYTAVFAGTSSATPMVSGAAVLTQEAALAQSLPALDSREMRAFLAATGIPQGTATAGNIGPFIDAGRAVQEVTHADLSIVTTENADVLTTTITNHGPREAALAQGSIIYGVATNSTVRTIVPINIPSSCQFDPNFPDLNPGDECLVQCPSRLVCDFSEMQNGEQKTIQVYIDNGGIDLTMNVESEVDLIDVLIDPVASNNQISEFFTIGIGSTPSAEQ